MEIDRLEIEIQAQATKASAELDKLIGKLNTLSGSLSSIQAGGLTDLANGITQLSISMQMIGNSKTSSFTKLANNIQKLGNINTGNMQNIANSINTFSSSINTIGSAGSNVQQISGLVSAVSKFGSIGMQRAITNLPLLANAVRNFITTISTAPNVSNNIINLTNSMANLAQFGARYNATINSITRASNTLTKANSRVTYSTKNMASSLALKFSKLLAAVYALRRAFNFLSGSIEKSMDFTETVNLFQTSFKKIGMEAAQSAGLEWGSEAANKFAVGFINEAQAFNDMLVDALSLDPNTIMNYQAVFAQMANGFGLANQSVMNLSKSFTMLGLDIASLFNLDVQSAMGKLQSGLAGEAEPLRALGIDITETTLKLTALKYGIKDSVSSMSQAAKTQLRYLAIMNQTTVAFGDMAKTIDSPANQLRVLRQQWNNLSRSIGNVFMPIVATVIPYVNALVIALRRMIDALATAVGFELPDYSNDAVYGGISTGIGDIGDTASDSEKSVNKLKKALLGIDEINILSSGSSKGSSGGGGAGGGYSELDDIINRQTESYLAKFNQELDGMSNKAEEAADKIVDFFKDIADAAKPTTEAVQRLANEGLAKLGGFVWDGLKSLYSDFLVPVGNWTLGVGLPSLLDVLNNLLSSIDWDKLSGAFSNLFQALSPFAINIGTGLISFIESVADILTPVIAGTVSLLADGLNLLADAINAIPEDVAIALGGAIGGIATAFLIYLGAIGVAEIVKDIGSAFSGMLGILTKHPLLTIAAAIAAVGGAVLALDKAKWNNSEIGKYTKALEASRKEADKFNAEVDEMLKKFDENKRDIETQYGAIDILAQKYFELADKTNLTNQEQLLLKAYAKDLVDQIPELSGVIDTQTGAYKGTKDEIIDLIQKTKEYYLVQAAQESLIEIAKKQYEAGKKLKGLEEEREILWGKIDEAGKKVTETEKEYNKALIGNSTEMANARKEFQALWEEADELNKTIAETEDSQNSLTKEWDYATDYIATYSDGVKTGTEKVKNFSGEVKDAKTTVDKQNFGKSASDKITDFNKQFGSDKTTYKSLTSWLSEAGKAITNYTAPKINVGFNVNTSDITSALSRVGGVTLGATVQKYATGGFPTPGELFIANEAGPEMIGRIGGRPAVANSDQIVQAVSAGVANAVAETMVSFVGAGSGSSVNTTVRVPVYIGKEQIAEAVLDGVNKRNRRFQTDVEFK